VEHGSSLILDATRSFITNKAGYRAKQGMTYTWICPGDFSSVCNSTEPILVLPWNEV